MLQNSKLVKFQKINRKITNGYLINSCAEVSFPYRIAFQEEISMTFLWYFYFLIKVVIFTKYPNSRTLDGINGKFVLRCAQDDRMDIEFWIFNNLYSFPLKYLITI
jgi:hypothetical protein